MSSKATEPATMSQDEATCLQIAERVEAWYDDEENRIEESAGQFAADIGTLLSMIDRLRPVSPTPESPELDDETEARIREYGDAAYTLAQQDLSEGESDEEPRNAAENALRARINELVTARVSSSTPESPAEEMGPRTRRNPWYEKASPERIEELLAQYGSSSTPESEQLGEMLNRLETAAANLDYSHFDDEYQAARDAARSEILSLFTRQEAELNRLSSMVGQYQVLIFKMQQVAELRSTQEVK